MKRTAVIDVAGLSESLLGSATPAISAFRQRGAWARITPAIPAVTCTAQANYLTGLTPAEVATRRDYMHVVKYFETNLHDVRLTFRWPMLPNGNSGPGRQVFRSMVSGPYTNDPPNSPFFFFRPNFYYRGS